MFCHCLRFTRVLKFCFSTCTRSTDNDSTACHLQASGLIQVGVVHLQSEDEHAYKNIHKRESAKPTTHSALLTKTSWNHVLRNFFIRI